MAAAAAEVLADNGVASSAATAMQTGSGLRLAQASGLLDGGETPTLNQLAAQALLRNGCPGKAELSGRV